MNINAGIQYDGVKVVGVREQEDSESSAFLHHLNFKPRLAFQGLHEKMRVSKKTIEGYH